VIEPTDEMEQALLREVDRVCVQNGCIRAGLAAVLAIVERDRKHPTSIRERLDLVVAEAIPVSGGRVRKALKHLRWALSELDAERAAAAERLAKWRGYQ
jgi:ubiquinone/menaquinone biosynthesis C-methylase UbiE